MTKEMQYVLHLLEGNLEEIKSILKKSGLIQESRNRLEIEMKLIINSIDQIKEYFG